MTSSPSPRFIPSFPPVLSSVRARAPEMVRERSESLKQATKANERLTKEKEVVTASRAELERHRDALRQEMLNVQKDLESQVLHIDSCVDAGVDVMIMFFICLLRFTSEFMILLVLSYIEMAN